MTAARTTSFSVDTVLSRIGYAFREGARWLLRGLLAITIICMAGVIAVVTAAVGLIVAAIAVLLLLTGARSGTARATRTHDARIDPDGVTLNAHRTARGWTVE